jgi:hypothetical protein
MFIEHIPHCAYALADPLAKKFLVVLIHCYAP